MPSIRVEMQTIETDHAQLLFLRRLRQISLQGDWTAEDGARDELDRGDGLEVSLMFRCKADFGGEGAL